MLDFRNLRGECGDQYNEPSRASTIVRTNLLVWFPVLFIFFAFLGVGPKPPGHLDGALLDQPPSKRLRYPIS